MKHVFGEALPKIPISATKSMIGHLLGGAGAAGGDRGHLLACAISGLHPSINVDHLDPAFDIDLVREARRADVRYAISNSAGLRRPQLRFGIRARRR